MSKGEPEIERKIVRRGIPIFRAAAETTWFELMLELKEIRALGDADIFECGVSESE
jgi:hypothetical protein